MAKKNSGVTTPSNPKDREKLKTMLTEMVKCMRRKADEAESQKEIGKEIKVLFNLAPKHVNKLAKTMYKQDYPEVQAEHQAFEELYESIVEGKASSEE
jgi:hypothetical protein